MTTLSEIVSIQDSKERITAYTKYIQNVFSKKNVEAALAFLKHGKKKKNSPF